MVMKTPVSMATSIGHVRGDRIIRGESESCEFRMTIFSFANLLP